MGKKYKFGIVGCGVIAPRHADAILLTKNAKLEAVCDIVEEKAKDLADKYAVNKYYTDYKELINDDNIDIVCICTPSGFHAEVAIYAANHGKHIFCEKPLDVSREKMDSMIKAVRENGVKMGCVFQRRTNPVTLAVKEAIDQGKFGELILADAYLKYYRSQAYYDSADWRGTWAMDGGGALMNQGVHGIDLLLWLAGDVESVFAKTAAQSRKIEVEDTAVAVLKFKNGAFGVIEGTTSVYPGRKTRLELHGKNGTVIFGDSGILEWKVEGNDEERAPDIKTDGISAKDDPTKIAKNSHLILVEDLVDAIANDREPFIPPEEARKAVDLILAIYESSRTGKEIFLY